eukprot:TRINITY_DN9181_c0_g1_i1.p1 TRINITY_DN9181_c0_g1~~TRINITY_DN9181_c0_g1_i1.p1  ORF type:complete len:1292 (-),score=311.78 TRINITY_DN9181_c0_g1_i1:89-3964(-)
MLKRSESVWWKKTTRLRQSYIPESDEYSNNFPFLEVVHLCENIASNETINAAKMVSEALALRDKWAKNLEQNELWEMPEDPFSTDFLPKANYSYSLEDGVYSFVDGEGKKFSSVPTIDEYLTDYNRLCAIIFDGPVKSLTYKRMKMIHHRFKLHKKLNSLRELKATQHDSRDFSNVLKVDTHIHLSAAMTGKHLLDFIKKKVKKEADVVVKTLPDGETQTLAQTFSGLGLKLNEFTLDALDVHADNTFQRFDNFNAKYNPFGKSDLRALFLKTSNGINGRYYAELTKELFVKLEESKYQAAEFRISVYGRKADDWDQLAKYMVRHKLYSHHQRWLVQVPRIYFVYRKYGMLENFQQLLDNLFKPLFEATIDPSSHPEVSQFLNQVSGFDSVDDESRPESAFDKKLSKILPKDYTQLENPPYAYWMYYFYANICQLNALRQERGMNTFSYRPHCGESGSVTHLVSAYLTSNAINHGIQLSHSTPLQYLYYLKRIGLAVSPLSNNKLFLVYNKNPFQKLFFRGLNVSLSTDDPLQFHFTEDPLSEEYAIAAQRWEFNGTDLSEIAQMSVKQSGFTHSFKKKFLGPDYRKDGVKGNDVKFTNVPSIRTAYREKVLKNEMEILELWSSQSKAEIDKYQLPIYRNPRDLSHYARLTITSGIAGKKLEVSKGSTAGCAVVAEALKLRCKYQHTPVFPVAVENAKTVLRFKDGVFQVYEAVVIEGREFVANEPIVDIPSFSDFFKDYTRLVEVNASDIVADFAVTRLKIIEKFYSFHVLLNGKRENILVQGLTKTDYHHVHKVDVFTHLKSSMHVQHLLAFMVKKIKEEPEKIITDSTDTLDRTLSSVFDRLNIPIEHFTVDSLNISEGDILDSPDQHDSILSDNPLPSSHLKNLFLEPINEIDGAFLGELCKETFAKLEVDPYHLHEFIIPIYGRTYDDWRRIANWVATYHVNSENVYWIIEFPQLYTNLLERGEISNFADLLSKWFKPVFDAVTHPEDHPVVAKFLEKVVGFTVPQEVADPVTHPVEVPQNWSHASNPRNFNYHYHVWANIQSLNALRLRKNLPELFFRPSCGRTGNMRDLCSAYLLADGIAGGVDLFNAPLMQYLYGLDRIGVALSPLYDNTMGITYQEHPFDRMFKRGLSVTFSTYRRLLHMTDQALPEEYAIGAQMWKYSITDLCEIARNSVRDSFLPEERKKEILGPDYKSSGVRSNAAHITNVPNIRVKFRDVTRESEFRFLRAVNAHASNPYTNNSHGTEYDSESSEEEKLMRAEQVDGVLDEGDSVTADTPANVRVIER